MDPWDDDGDEHDPIDRYCDECQGTGRVPAPDYMACMGWEYFACPECEAGWNSGEILESEAFKVRR